MEATLHEVNVQWTADLSVGSALMDEHNRQMFNQLAGADAVIESMEAPALATWMRSVLDRLDLLLQAEERELDRVDYPELAFHRQLHGRARARMQATRAQLDQAPAPGLLQTMVRASCSDLSVWLMRHVQDADKLFFPYVDVRYRSD